MQISTTRDQCVDTQQGGALYNLQSFAVLGIAPLYKSLFIHVFKERLRFSINILVLHFSTLRLWERHPAPHRRPQSTARERLLSLSGRPYLPLPLPTTPVGQAGGTDARLRSPGPGLSRPRLPACACGCSGGAHPAVCRAF